MIQQTLQENTYNIIMSLEALALSANAWQLTTLKPYPSHEYPLTSMVSMRIWSCPVFSTLKVLFNVKFGSLSFKPKGKKWRVSINLAIVCSRFKWLAHSLQMCARDHELPPHGFSRKYSTFACHLKWQKFDYALSFTLKSMSPKVCNEYGYFNLLRSKLDNPKSKSGCFLKKSYIVITNTYTCTYRNTVLV